MLAAVRFPARSTWPHVLLVHLLLGVPVAAVLESAVQWAAGAHLTAQDVAVFFASVALVALVGSVVLLPAFALQAGLVIALASRGVGRPWLVVTGAVLQAGLVVLYALVAGLEPSLPGRFPITPPMTVAGLVAGAVVAWAATRPPTPQPQGSSTSRFGASHPP